MEEHGPVQPGGGADGERGDAGQAIPLVVLLLVAAAGTLLVLGAYGHQLLRQARVQTAADAAALAGAASGARAAHVVAEANGATMVDFERLPGGDVRVRVEREGARAGARARAELSAPPTGGGLAPAMRAALARAEQLLGRPVPVVSGRRSPVEQRRLWERRADNRYPVAPPGSSQHERGLAIDVPTGFVQSLLEVGPQAGLCQPLPRSDPVHFEVCGGGFTRGAEG
ncbi:MAG TPA: M15 family metallopeptidase [Acidimicrobiales bacterium]|nr:M15 family metallopeptidase [Acidimicrobiales bacterium]